MNRKNEELQEVYTACRAIFSGSDALIRSQKRVKQAITKNRDFLPSLISKFSVKDIIIMSKFLLERKAFQSNAHAAALFPNLFESTPQQHAEREASEADAVRSVANALDELSQSEAEDELEIQAVPERTPTKTEAPPAYNNSLVVEENRVPIDAVPVTRDSAEPYEVDSGATLTRSLPHLGVPSLYPSFLPYNTQHTILNTTQRILEECCFDFAKKWIPHVLQEQNWDCPSAVELTKWTKVFNRVGPKMPAHATKPAGKSIKNVLAQTHQLRHIAVHRQPTTVREISKHLRAALTVAELLQDVSRAGQLRSLISEVDEKNKAMELLKNVLENHTLTSLGDIRRQREALDRQEKELIQSMVEEDRDHRALIGRLLETTVTDIFEKKLVRGQMLEEEDCDVEDVYYEASEEHVDGTSENLEDSIDIELAGKYVANDVNGLWVVD